MDKDQVKRQLKAYLVESMQGEPGAITDSTSLFDTNLLDSLGIVKLVAFMEEQYECTFDYEELTEENLSTVDAIASLIVKKKSSE
jgi:acyl carrier protein